VSDTTPGAAGSGRAPSSVPAQDATIEHVALPADDTTVHDAPLADPDPLVADPSQSTGSSGSGGFAGPSGPSVGTGGSDSGSLSDKLSAYFPEEQPERLLGAALAGGVLSAILLRTLVRR
jgi:hypothetical protein